VYVSPKRLLDQSVDVDLYRGFETVCTLALEGDAMKMKATAFDKDYDWE
jgi:hypothetical protein